MRVLQSVRQLSQRTVLPNGATVITQANNSGLGVVGLVSRCGSRAELNSSETTLNRSTTVNNIPSMAGVKVNSYVHRERAGVFGTAIPAATGAFAKNLVAAANVREVADKDRAHALAQLNAASQDKSIVTDDYLHMTAYQDTPLGNSPFGTTAGIVGTAESDVLNFRSFANGGSNVVLVGTGNVNHEELCEAAADLAEEGGNACSRAPCQFTGSIMTDRNDFEEDVWIRTGFQVPGLNKPRDNAVFEVLKHVFGSYTPGEQHVQHSVNPLIKSFNSSRPNRRMHSGGSHNYNFASDVKKIDGVLTSYSDTALFGFYTHVPDAYGHSQGVLEQSIRGANVHYRLFRELKRMWCSLSDYEIAAAKNKAILEFHQGMSNPMTLADTLGRQGLISESTANPNTPTFLAAVNKKTIEAAVHKYMFDQEFAEAWYGCADAHTDATTQKNRSWNFFPGGQGLDIIGSNKY